MHTKMRTSGSLNMKIKVSNLLLAIFTSLMLFPDYYSNSIVGASENAVSVLVVLFLLLKGYRPNKATYAIVLYFTTLIALTFLNSSPAADIHFLISRLKLVLLLLLLDCYYRDDEDKATATLFWIILILVVADIISVLLHPSGLYYSTITWNEWSSSLRGQWILGNKNSKASYYILLLLLTGIYYGTSGKGYLKALSVVLVFMEELAVIIVRSSTSSVCVLVAGIGLILYIYRKKAYKNGFSVKAICIVYVILFLTMVFSSTQFYQSVIKLLFQKDSTFSGRTYIWLVSLDLIAQRPITGWGYWGGENMALLYGGASYTSAHNQILNTAFEGGILLLVELIAFFAIVIDAVDSCPDERKLTLLKHTLVAVMILMLFESVLSGIVSWVILLLCVEFAAYGAETHNVHESGSRHNGQ